MKAGLLGEKLGHSYSVELHKILGLKNYELFERKKEEISSLLASDFSFLNVTIPYKREVLKYLDFVSSEAEEIGACNTIVKTSEGLKGFNTDYYGIAESFKAHNIEVRGKKIGILGTGGAALTLKTYFKREGAKEILLVSRTPKGEEISYEEVLKKHNDIQILCNATPVGMYPDTENIPIELKSFTCLEFVFDLVYNPVRTRLIQEAKKLGIAALSGLYMLAAQGYYSQQLAGLSPKLSPGKAYEELLKEKENIVLIGMPTAGKTTLGRILGKKLGKPVVDLDEYIESLGEGTVSEIFQIYGEKGFRNMEALAVKKIGSLSGQIISCGGGAPLFPDNLFYLRSNGKLYYLDRPFQALKPAKDRPLSAGEEALRKMYLERTPVYEEIADITLDKELTLEELGERFS